MKLQTVRTILDAAMENQQHGVIKYDNDSVDFDFTDSALQRDEQDLIGYNSETEVISVLGKARCAYIGCEAIQCIEVYR